MLRNSAMHRRAILVVTAVVFSAAGCGLPTSLPETVAPQAAPTATVEPAPTETAGPTPPAFEPATYRDEGAGFELDYPVDWTADPPMVGGDRGTIGQITSWSRTPGEPFDSVPPGETIVSLTVLRWDPVGDLDAFLAVRWQGWTASGFEPISQEEWTLPGGWRAVAFRFQTPEMPSFTLITTVGDRYLVVGGSGDLATVEAIARTLRPIGSAP